MIWCANTIKMKRQNTNDKTCVSIDCPYEQKVRIFFGVGLGRSFAIPKMTTCENEAILVASLELFFDKLENL